MLPCLDLPVSDYESVRINNLCHQITLHILKILYTIFEDGKVWTVAEFLRLYSYRFTERSGLVVQKEPFQ